MAGGRSYQRGEDYFAADRVGALLEHDGAVTAKVRGTRAYRVELWAQEDTLGFSCTCPVGDEGAFCKHCVAVFPVSGWWKDLQRGIAASLGLGMHSWSQSRPPTLKWTSGPRWH